jgi:hypothetical protein
MRFLQFSGKYCHYAEICGLCIDAQKCVKF